MCTVIVIQPGFCSWLQNLYQCWSWDSQTAKYNLSKMPDQNVIVLTFWLAALNWILEGNNPRILELDNTFEYLLNFTQQS
jgi:hypothetical protein